MSKVQVISELWEFMRHNKKYWLAPIVITLIVFGVVLVLAKSSAIAPFIYTLF
jgi:drug/metabolite transporter superfamily protein YnfA